MTDLVRVAVGMLVAALFTPIGWIGLLVAAIFLHGLAVLVRTAAGAC